ncbi:MAG: amidase, partial [Hyphomicrobiales bacterium]|nr:amidase [Hyphomicrobiales bacterium]
MTLTYATLRDQIAALAARKISAAELLEETVARIAKYDGKINAVVVRDFERARAQAKEADRALARGERRPLLGAPVTVKESYNVAGLPTTWGSPAAREWRPKEDAVLVSRLKAAGAVVAGKTNVPLSLADWQSYNEVYGVTSNPWDLGRTPGGSSGGAAASLAAGYVALELGSDIGGSLRVPAHFCGVFAHKPTYALLPMRGHTAPGLPPLPYWRDLSVVGPMARSAADLSLAFDLLAGPDEHEATAYSLTLPPPRANRLDAFHVLALDAHPQTPTSAAVRSAIDVIAQRLQRAGAKVARQSPLLPDLTLVMKSYQTLLMSIFGSDLPDDRFEALRQRAAALPADVDTLDAQRARGLVATHRDWIKADRIRAGINAQWRELFRAFDVVLCPVSQTAAFPHDHSPDQRARLIVIDGAPHPYQDQLAWPSLATLSGLPATAAPIGRSPEGLPIG